MKKNLLLFIAIGLITIGIGCAEASTVMSFGSVEGSSHARITPVGGITLDFGTLELKDLDMGDDLFQAKVDISDVSINTASKVSNMGFALYEASEKDTSSGFTLWADIDNNASLELILTADIHIDNLLVFNEVGFVDAELAIDVDNFTIHNEAMMISEWGGVPALLDTFITMGLADLAVVLTSESGINLEDQIDSGNLVPDIIVAGTLQAVPEPGAMSLMLLGLLYFIKRKK